MEIDITTHVLGADHPMVSGSRAELGNDAGRITWQNALSSASDFDLTDEQADSVRDWAAGFGAWDEDEIAAWSHDEVTALLCQYVSGDIRGLQAFAPSDDDDAGNIDWDEAERLAEDGTVGGSIYRGDDGRFYIYVER